MRYFKRGIQAIDYKGVDAYADKCNGISGRDSKKTAGQDSIC